MSLSRMLLLCCILLATVFALAAPAPAPTTGPASSSAVAIQTYLQPDLSLKSVLATGSLQLAGGPPHILRTCACSCGFPCTTDADCGGGACTAGITCCARDPKNPVWTNTSASRKHPAPVFAAKCK
jgi:hypothetical protein